MMVVGSDISKNSAKKTGIIRQLKLKSVLLANLSIALLNINLLLGIVKTSFFSTSQHFATLNCTPALDPQYF
jgi:hypothetical protein